MSKRVLILANRLPYKMIGGKSVPSTGGLVRALLPILSAQGGGWIGWDGCIGVKAPSVHWPKTTGKRYFVESLRLTQREYNKFYVGFANEVVWPLFHQFPMNCRFKPSYWQAYYQVNQKFAKAAASLCHQDDMLWVHDYHLMSVAHILRDVGVKNQLGWFLHIPFPPPELFAVLPWRKTLLMHLLDYDLLGFQTPGDAQNFLRCVDLFLPQATIKKNDGNSHVACQGREVRVQVFPISVDAKDFIHRASLPAVEKQADYIRSHLKGTQILFALERLDYSKGVPHKLRAFYHLLKTKPKWRDKVRLVLCVIPSREHIEAYASLKEEIEHWVSKINGAFTTPSCVPVRYLYHPLTDVDLLAYYRAADVMLVTPLKDGMNLVAKEFVLTNAHSGVLLLSEFAGAAQELSEQALMVNPYDVESFTAQIERALSLPKAERKKRFDALKDWVQDHDVFAWAASYQSALSQLHALPKSVKTKKPKTVDA